MLQWTYFDPNLPASVEAGMARLRSSDFSSGLETAQHRELGAVLALKAVLVGHLLGTITYDTAADGQVSASITGDLSSAAGERGDAARALVAPHVYYYAAAGLPALEDSGSFAVSAPADVGVWPLAVIIAVAIGGAAVIGWTEQKIVEVVKFFHTQNTQVSEIHRLDAAVTDAMNKHVQAEVNAKAPIPMSDAEKAQIAALNSRIAQLQGQLAEPPSPGFLSQIPWYAWLLAGGAVVVIGAATILPRASTFVMPRRLAA